MDGWISYTPTQSQENFFKEENSEHETHREWYTAQFCEVSTPARETCHTHELVTPGVVSSTAGETPCACCSHQDQRPRTPRGLCSCRHASLPRSTPIHAGPDCPTAQVPAGSYPTDLSAGHGWMKRFWKLKRQVSQNRGRSFTWQVHHRPAPMGDGALPLPGAHAVSCCLHCPPGQRDGCLPPDLPRL